MRVVPLLFFALLVPQVFGVSFVSKVTKKGDTVICMLDESRRCSIDADCGFVYVKERADGRQTVLKLQNSILTLAKITPRSIHICSVPDFLKMIANILKHREIRLDGVIVV